MRYLRATCAAVVLMVSAACSQAAPVARGTPAPPSTVAVTPQASASAVAQPTRSPRPAPAPSPKTSKAVIAPAWLGTRVLPRTATGYGQVRPTPRVLRDRRFITVDRLPPPPWNRFAGSVQRVPREVAGRSTWSEECPVALDDLRYVTVSFWGFDDRAHTGELLVNAAVAGDVLGVFRRLYRQRFPIEQMRIVSPVELELPPTGDGNNTTAFVCRPARGSTSWSQHAYGLAVDVNPFHNPYVKGDVVLPELASAYTHRARRRPGMHFADGAAVRAFEAIGWEWGGNWSGLHDWMHFSANGR